MNSLMSSFSTEISISCGNFRCTNCAGVTVSCALFIEASIDSWVGELLCPVWIHVLWSGVYTSYSILLSWAASRGECLSVAG